jgi:hypothetical protein
MVFGMESFSRLTGEPEAVVEADVGEGARPGVVIGLDRGCRQEGEVDVRQADRSLLGVGLVVVILEEGVHARQED